MNPMTNPLTSAPDHLTRRRFVGTGAAGLGLMGAGLPALAQDLGFPRKVYAHYFPPYPLSFENQQPELDHYTKHYLTVHGEGSKHAAYGGFLRDRPIGRSPLSGTPEMWNIRDYETEVRTAKAMGLDGFIVDLLSDDKVYSDRHRRLIIAAANVGGFDIVLCPDMDTGWSRDRHRMLAHCKMLASYAPVLKLNGRLVLSPFNSETIPPRVGPQGPITPDWWRATLKLFADNGLPVFFIPMFLNWYEHYPKYASFADGYADWGGRHADSQRPYSERTRFLRRNDPRKLIFAPAAPQDVRPRNNVYREARGSTLLRESFLGALQADAQWIQLITWNDYSENTHISPSMNTQYGYTDVASYYIHWFKNRRPPTITADTLFYFHRPHLTTARPTRRAPMVQEGLPVGPAVNRIELLAFLTSPGTLEIEIAGQVTRVDVPAGIQSITAPEAPGVPKFRLRRGNGTVIELESKTNIASHIEWQSLVYHSGGSNRSVPGRERFFDAGSAA